MAKRDYDFESRKMKAGVVHKICSAVIADSISREMRKKTPEKKGIRQIVLETYHSKGILEAYQVLQEYNKKLYKPIYTREMFETWIAEEQRKKGYEKDDGNDR